jgi:hypothetical protein
LVVAGAFAADAAVVTFSGSGGGEFAGVGMLAQQVSFGYQQQITRLFEIGSNNMYYVAGRSQGNASIARVLGPVPVSVAFYQYYGDVCGATGHVLTFSLMPGCETPGNWGDAINLSLTGALIMSVGFGVAAENMVINEQLSLMYASLMV